MSRKNDEVNIGTVILDAEAEDITAPWREVIKGSYLEDSEYTEKCCLYLTLYNNFLVQYKDSYPKKISCIDTYGAFIIVLLNTAIKFEDETIKDIKAFFEFWIDFLNDNADYLDRFDDESFGFDVIMKRFSITLKNILEDGNEQ